MLSKMKEPTKTNLEFFQDWLRRPTMGNFPIISKDRDAWVTETKSDLIVVDDQHRNDIFTAWVCEKLIPAFHALIGKYFKENVSWDPASGLSSYSDRRLQRIIDGIGTLVSSLFPTLSIVILYYVRKTVLRLVIIAAFTSLFSICLTLLTQGRRVEVFAAAAA
jgi:hypothetical protein